MDYTNQQKAFILKMDQVDAQHRADAQARNTQPSAPRAIGGKVQPKSPRGPKIRKVKVKSHQRTVKPRTPSATKPGLDTTQKALLDAAVKLRYGGQEQAINQQLQQNARFTSGVPAWYQQAIGEIKGIGATQMAQNQQTLQGIQNYNSPAAQTGTPEAQQAAAARNSLNSQYATMFGRDAQANSDFMARMQAGMQTQQGNTLNAANHERQNLLAQQGQLRGEEGSYKTQLLSEQQSAAAKADLEDRKLQASLAIADGKLNLARDILNNVTKPKTQATIRQGRSKVRQGAARVRNEQARIRETKKQHGVDNAIKVNRLALDAYMKAHPELSKKGGATGQSFTPTQVRSAQKKFRTIHGSLKPEYVKQHPELSIRRIIKEKGVDPLMARAIVQSIAGGGVDRKTATAFYRAYGFHLKVNDLGEKTVGNVIKFFQQ